MNSLDKDGNGAIDYQEFITAAINKVAILSKPTLQAAFKVLDYDNSGMITKDDLKAVFDTHGDKKDESLWLSIIEEVDTNKDNQISFDEFYEAMTCMFQK